VAWTGFEQSRVGYDRKARTKGTSGWNFGKMMKAMYDAFIGLSTLPIRLMKIAAVTAFVLSLMAVIYLVVVVAFLGTRAPGWASQMILLAAFFGVQFSMMAIVGEYLNRIYTESMRRPLYFIAKDTEEQSPRLRGGPPSSIQTDRPIGPSYQSQQDQPDDHRSRRHD